MKIWNLGTLTGRGREIVDVMERRKVEILCIQEIKWSRNSARQMGKGYKLLYASGSQMKNGVGILLNKELAEKVVDVERSSDKLIRAKVCIGKELWNVVSAYARNQEEPEKKKRSS